MIKVTIIGRGACRFIVKNLKKITFWKGLANRSNPKTFQVCCVTYKDYKERK